MHKERNIFMCAVCRHVIVPLNTASLKIERLFRESGDVLHFLLTPKKERASVTVSWISNIWHVQTYFWHKWWNQVKQFKQLLGDKAHFKHEQETGFNSNAATNWHISTRKETSLHFVFSAELTRRHRWFRICRSRFIKFVTFLLMMQQLFKSDDLWRESGDVVTRDFTHYLVLQGWKLCPHLPE